MSVALLINFCACLYLTGLIWTIQIVHYPAFYHIGKKSFNQFIKMHTKRMGYIVSAPMLIELISSSYLAMDHKSIFFYANFAFVIFIWISTAFLSVPKHRILKSGKNKSTIAALVKTNWPRTVLWTCRSLSMFVYILNLEFLK